MMRCHRFAVASVCAVLMSGCTEGIADDLNPANRGREIYVKECAQCHGLSGEGAGAASLGLGGPPPDLTGLRARNDGYFPREFVRRFVLGSLEKDDPDAAMPEFGKVGLRHVYPKGGEGAETLQEDIGLLLDYLETIQQ